jgi:DNA repair exonuclease SbcCD ATPase subunit
MGPSETIEIDEGDLLQKAGERSALPRKVKRLEQQLEQLSSELKELKDQLQSYRKLGNRASQLRTLIHEIKRMHPELVGHPVRIGIVVDKALQNAHKELRSVCPKGWLKPNQPLPRLFSLAVKDPHFRKLALPLISKA